MRVKRAVPPVPPPPPGRIVLATVLYGVLLLIASKFGVPSTDLAVAAGLWSATFRPLGRLRR